jgi:hypothetical protein
VCRVSDSDGVPSRVATVTGTGRPSTKRTLRRRRDAGVDSTVGNRRPPR